MVRSDVVDQRLTRNRNWFDAGVAVVLTAGFVAVTGLFADHWSRTDRPVDLGALTLVGASFLVLALRRNRPLLTLGAVTVFTTAYLLASYPYGPIFGAFFIAVYTTATELPFRTAAMATAAAMVTMLTHVFVHPDALGGWRGFIPGTAWAVVPFAIGVSVRTARQTRKSAQEDALRRQLYDERMRVAQEVHDVVGHGLAAIQLQADIALHVDEQQAPRTRNALEAISRASKAAFDELASTLDGIQHPTRDAGSPGIDDIEELCERMEAAGIDIDLTVERNGQSHDEQAELAAYRVVQEALTNVIRHGTIPRAFTSVHVDDETITIRVSNPGPTTSPYVGGRGLTGMRRRVVSLGGSLTAGPTDDGFEVKATIPHQGSS